MDDYDVAIIGSGFVGSSLARFLQTSFSVKTFDEIVLDLEIRDDKDTNRENSPLRKAVDAVEIDTSDLTIDEQVNKIINHIKNN